jgi:hypothetical protein
VSFEVESKLSVGTILECKNSHNFMYSHGRIESLEESHGKEFKISIINWGTPEKETIWFQKKYGDHKYYHKVTLRDDYLYFQRFSDDPFGSDISVKKISVNGQTDYFFSTTGNHGNNVWVKHGKCSKVK